MKIHIEVDPDEGQSVTVVTRDTTTGSDLQNDTVGPGQVAVVDMPAGASVVLIGGEVHYDTGKNPALVPDPTVITGNAVTEPPKGDKVAAQTTGELTPASPAKVAEVAKVAVDDGAETTADGKIQVAALNQALADQGHAPVDAAARDAAHEANAT